MFIEAKDLSFSYRENEPLVVDGVSLSIKKGSYNVIIGHNGSGKSTLAKLLCGILAPVSGSVTVAGLDTADENNIYAIREKCGMVFQNPDNQLVASVVEEDVAFAPENLGYPRDEIRRRITEALKTVDMEGSEQRVTYKLSGGQKQRIAIAGILAMEPECIIFDEATAMLDPSGRREIISAMKKLNKEKGITVVSITHFMSEAAEADRVIVLNKGKVYKDGTPKEIFSQVEELKSVSLSAPQITELLYLLNNEGCSFPKGILHTMEAADAIERAFNERA